MRPSASSPGDTLSPPAGRARSARTRLQARLGGAEGNEILTSAAAVVLIVLLAAEGVTIVHMQGLVSAHMFIGMVLIPPVVLKLGSTGYRFARYYTRARPYREKGPPFLPLRVLAPVLVASTIAVFVSGVLLLAAGNKSGGLLEIHKLSFIVFGLVLVPHVFVYLVRAVRSVRTDWRAARRAAVPGTGLRATLVALAVGGGGALALAVLPSIHAWHG
jgi:hypothetical protein